MVINSTSTSDEIGAVTSPTSGLPSELLSEIFLCFRFDEVEYMKSYDMRRRCGLLAHINAPLELVCKRWRSVIISDARMWTTIPIAMGVPNLKFITRSGSLPVDVVLDISAAYVRDSTNARILFDAMVGLLPRTVTLAAHICIFGGISANWLPSPANHSYPHISSIQWHVWGLDHTTPSLWHTGLFAIMPSLTRLDIYDVPLSMVLDAITALPSLKTLRVRRVHAKGASGLPPESRILVHLELRELIVGSPNDDDSDVVLNHITLPHLSSLDVGGNIHKAWPFPSHVDFFIRSQCSLTDLVVRESPAGPRLVEILQIQPGITRLHLLHQLEHRKGTGILSLRCQSHCQTGIATSVLKFLAATDRKTTAPSALPCLVSLSVSTSMSLEHIRALKCVIQARLNDLSFIEVSINAELDGTKKEQRKKRAEVLKCRDSFKAYNRRGLTVSSTARISYPEQ